MVEKPPHRQPDGSIALDDLPLATLQEATLEVRRPFSRFLATADVIVAVIITVGAILLALFMNQLVAKTTIETERNFATLTPAIIPEISFTVLAGFGIFALALAIKTLRGPVQPASREEMARYVRGLQVALIAVFYALAVPVLGYIFATILVSLGVAFYLGLRNPLLFIPGGIVLPIAIRFIFERLLLISLPRSGIEWLAAIDDSIMRTLAHLFLQ